MLGGRHSNTLPDSKAIAYEKQVKQYSMVVGKFIKGHRLKFQSDITYNEIIGAGKTNFWQLRFQLEIGI
jgi:hypothetical protein